MNSAFRDLAIGIMFAAVFVYVLMVVNYQTRGDPFVVILALPATFCAIVTMLYITNTTLNVPSLMGAIMAIGVASANSILLVTFAHNALYPQEHAKLAVSGEPGLSDNPKYRLVGPGSPGRRP